MASVIVQSMISRLQTYQNPQTRNLETQASVATKKRTPREIFASLRKCMEEKNNGQISLTSEGKWGLFETEERRVNKKDVIRKFKISADVDIYLKLRGISVKSDDFRRARLDGVDNTGLSKLWPSEACLALHCVSDLGAHVFTGKRILELGAGQSGLCGLAIASQFYAESVVLSDGNLTCIEYLTESININKPVLKCPVSCERIMWDTKPNRNVKKFDVIVLADCFFFTNFHQELFSTLDLYLSENGVIYSVQPNRDDTRDKFCKLMEQEWDIYLVANFNQKVFEKHLVLRKKDTYSDEFNQPRLTIFRRKVSME